MNFTLYSFKRWLDRSIWRPFRNSRLRRRRKQFIERTIVGRYWNRIKIAVCFFAAGLAFVSGMRQLGLSLRGLLPKAWLDDQGFVSSTLLGYLWLVEAFLLLVAAALFWYTGREEEGEAMSGWQPSREEIELENLRKQLRELAQSTQQVTDRLSKAEKKIEESAIPLNHGGHGSPDEARPVPGHTITDQVYFTLTAPGVLAPGRSYALDVWAHYAEGLSDILERAKEELGTGNIRSKSKGAIQIARGTLITVNLHIADLVVDDPEDTILWDGEVGNATFPVMVPLDAPLGSRPGIVTLLINAMQVAKIHFVLEVGIETQPLVPIPAKEERVRSAFASYASEDRDEVLSRIQGMQKVFPALDVFVDVASLHSGEQWYQRLLKEIETRDTFYLFWSSAASRSEWVEKEWRAALQSRGIDYIDPVPLVSPQAVPPPQELAAHLHFNDWVLAYMRGKQPMNDAPHSNQPA